MKKILFSLLSVAILSGNMSAQYIQKMHYSSSFFGPNNAIKTASGDYIVNYTPMSPSTPSLMRWDAAGNILWNLEYNNGGFAYDLSSFTELANGNLLGLGSNNQALNTTIYDGSNGSPLIYSVQNISFSSGGNFGNMKLAASGNNAFFIASASNTRDSLFIGEVSGTTGLMVFVKAIDINFANSGQPYSSAYIIDMCKTASGDFLALVDISTNSPSSQTQAIIKFTTTGNLLFIKYYNPPVGTTSMNGNDICEAANGDLIVSGTMQAAGVNNAYAIRFNSSANPLWAKRWVTHSGSAFCTELANGSITIGMSGQTMSPDNFPRTGLCNISSSGNMNWYSSFGQTGGNMIGVYPGNSGFTTCLTSNNMNGTNGSVTLASADATGGMTGCSEFVTTVPSFSVAITTNSVTVVPTSMSPSLGSPTTFSSSSGLIFNTADPGIILAGTVTNPLCYGGFGSVNITVSNGTPNYAYSWSNGTSGQNLPNVYGGVYSIHVVDSRGCTEVDTFTVVSPAQLSTTYSVANVTCYGLHNGSINVTTSGGTPGYHWQWTTQDTTEDLSSLNGGFYQLTLTDANGCQKMLAVSVSEPQQLIAGIISSQNVKCHGACDGSLTGIASGGTQPYTYLWNNANNSTTTSIIGLCPGNYLFSVTDSKFCNTFSNAVITEPSALSISTSTLGSLCGVSTGEAAIAVTGGILPYTYQWSTSSTNDTAFNLSATSYSVNVLDANNCAINANVNVGLVTPTPQLCMVTVDSLSTHNILLWDKTGLNHIDYFNIYREDITNNYTLIAAVNYNALSEYHDYDTLMADPNITTKRYKISAVDSCGNESVKSNFHNTIFMQHNNGAFTWNTYTIQNSANPVTSYVLMRDDLSNGNWQQIGITAGTQNILNDPNYTTFQNTASWKVETIWSISCSPTLRQNNGTQAAIVRSKSNISNNRAVGIKSNTANMFAVYPNPATDVLTIEIEKLGNNCKIEIVNMLGEVVKQSSINEYQSKINVADLVNGMYNLKITSADKQVFTKKLLIQR